MNSSAATNQPPRPFQRLIARAARLLARGVYRSVEVDNAEPGWSHHPSLIVANHPTGFSDPALLFGLLERNPRFLAKATLWKTPGLGWFLDRVGAIPVHRAQDGSTTGNAEAFAAAFAALQDGDSIAMFPEGKAQEPPHLAPIKTGAARIALGAHEAGVTGIRIVPIGIHYEDKAAVRSRAYVNVGDVLELDAELAAVLGDFPRSAESHASVERLTDEIGRRLAASAPDYATDAEAAAFGVAAEVALRDADAVEVRYSDRQRLAASVGSSAESNRTALVEEVDRYRTALAAAGIEDVDLVRSMRPASSVAWGRLSLLLLMLPLAVAGVVLNIIPYLTLMFTMRYRHDSMTPSTIRMVAAVLSFLAMWLGWAAVAWSLWNWRMGLVALVAAPLYGAVALYVLDHLTEWWRVRRGRRSVASLSPETTAALLAERSALAASTRQAASQ